MLKKIESWFSGQIVQKKLLYLSLLCIAALMFLLNHYVYMMHDDYIYSVVKYGEKFQFPEHLVQIWDAMTYYYMNWGGRLIATTSAYLVLLFPIPIQDFLNTCVFVILMLYIYKLVKKQNSDNVLLLLLIFGSTVILPPTFIASAVWITGSGGFLWTTTISILFIYPYVKSYGDDKKYKNSSLRYLGMFFFGIVAGCSSENLAVGITTLTLLYCFVLYRNKQLATWHIVGFVGLLIGSSILMFSPGSAVRIEQEGYGSGGIMASLDILPQKISSLWGYYKYFLRYPFLIYALCLGLFLYTYKGNERAKILMHSLLFLFAANVTLLISIFAPNFPPRAFFSVTVFVIVAFSILYAHIDFRNFKLKLVNLVLLGVVLGFCAYDYGHAVKAFRFIYNVEQQREHQIDECKANGVKEITLERVKIDYFYNYMESGPFRSDYYQMNIEFEDTDE